MRVMQAISTLLFLIALSFFLFDLFCYLYEFSCQLFGLICPSVERGLLQKISIENVWKAVSKENYEITKSMTSAIIPSDIWTVIAHMPAPTALFILGLVFYIPFKILRLLGAGKRS